jgi:hypothetical protein
MSTITDDTVVSTISGSIHLESYSDQWAGSQGYSDLTPSPFVGTIHLGYPASTAPLTTGFNTYYKLQGYNASTGQYEVWHCMNTVVFTPPSGHPLINVSVVSTWTDR